MRVEPATTADLDAVVDAWVALADTQRAHGSHLAAASNRETIRPLLAHHVVDGSLLVARTDNAVVGFTNVGLEDGALDSDATRGIVHNLYVEPGARGEGVGSALLDAAEALLRDRGADVIAIEAMADNADARRLYRRRGYDPHRVQFERSVESGDSAGTTETDTSETG